jgi:hypothetical protein
MNMPLPFLVFVFVSHTLRDFASKILLGSINVRRIYMGETTSGEQSNGGIADGKWQFCWPFCWRIVSAKSNQAHQLRCVLARSSFHGGKSPHLRLSLSRQLQVKIGGAL